MNSSLRRRVEMLEQTMGAESIAVHLPDGSTRRIRADARHWKRLHEAWTVIALAELDSEPEPVSPLSAELDAIRDGVLSGEDIGYFQLLQVLLQGPNLDGEVPE